MELLFLEKVLSRCPDEPEVLKALGDLYTRVGEFEKGLAVDLLLRELCPDEAGVWYNLGCSYALVGRAPDSLAALRKALELGWNDRRHLLEDEDLASVREHPEFRELIEQCG